MSDAAKRYPWTKFPASGRNWNPEAEPFRVVWYYPSADRGLSGWTCAHRMFTTAEAAIECVRANMGICTSVLAQRLSPDGKSWLKVAERKRKAEIKIERAYA